MTNVEWNSFDELRDVEAINQTQELMEHHDIGFDDVRHVVKHRSRDNARTPMQWSDEPNAGFTEGEPWIKVSEDYPTINVEADRNDEDSIWHYYQELIDLRNEEEVLIYGKYHLLLENHPEIYAYTRTFDDETALIVLNAYDGRPTFELPEFIHYDDATLLISNYDDADGDPRAFDLRPYEARVYKLQ